MTVVEAEPKSIRLELSSENHRRFRVEAAKEGLSMAAVARRLVEDYLSQAEDGGQVMAPTPTELLAEDVGSLRESDRQLTESIKTLTASVNDLRTEFAGFKGSIESDMRTIRWLGSFFAGILVVLVGSAITLSWQAAVLSTEVNVQGDRLDKVEQRLDKVDQRFDQLEKRMDKTDAKLDLIFQRIDQVIARPSPKP